MDPMQLRTLTELLPMVGRTVRVSGPGGYRDEEIHAVDMHAGTVERTVVGRERQTIDADHAVWAYAGFAVIPTN